MHQHRKLPWPASLISRSELHLLWKMSQKTGKPITQLVHESIKREIDRLNPR